jgi:hypothetical protein
MIVSGGSRLLVGGGASLDPRRGAVGGDDGRYGRHPERCCLCRDRRRTAERRGTATIPANLLPLFVGAERAYGVPWNVLAAINKVETDFGRILGPSPAGAIGWMQFEPATWLRYERDANRDGYANPDDPATRSTPPPPTCAPPAPRETCAARCSPTTTPAGTSTRSSPGRAATPTAPTRRAVRRRRTRPTPHARSSRPHRAATSGSPPGPTCQGAPSPPRRWRSSSASRASTAAR